jgi:hypothetical protein
MRQKFVSDDGHWYLINAEDKAEFERFSEWSGEPDQDAE